VAMCRLYGPAIQRSAVYIVGLLAFLYYVEWTYIRDYHSYMLQGRYLLPVYGAMVVGGLLGVDALLAGRYRSVLAISVEVFVVALNAATLMSMVHQYYGIGVAL
jgi:hypothetical protein